MGECGHDLRRQGQKLQSFGLFLPKGTCLHVLDPSHDLSRLHLVLFFRVSLHLVLFVYISIFAVLQRTPVRHAHDVAFDVNNHPQNVFNSVDK